MKTADYTSTLLVDESPKEAFKAITNIRGWWSEEIEGITDKLNEEFFYHYKDIHLTKMKLVELVPEQKVAWLVLDNSFNFIEDKSEWVGTKLIFEISKEGDKTKVKFTHEGLVPQDECFEVCNEAWTNYIQKSLRKLITTGKGEPNPKEGDGFNAEIAEKWKLNK
ncbi:SRPBCC family protein [Aequorivita nionensis]|uniref:SRPBCC family protein n=1 Tax=Aequorivita nionensis TaxID=1287690 RepID=UPI0039659967